MCRSKGKGAGAGAESDCVVEADLALLGQQAQAEEGAGGDQISYAAVLQAAAQASSQSYPVGSANSEADGNTVFGWLSSGGMPLIGSHNPSMSAVEQLALVETHLMALNQNWATNFAGALAAIPLVLGYGCLSGARRAEPLKRTPQMGVIEVNDHHVSA